MKSINLSFFKYSDIGKINLNSSKSESNRILIIQALCNKKINIHNLSKAKDTLIMKNILSNEEKKNWNARDAGTAMRFLTAYLALNHNNKSLTGTKRMQNRPISLLVNSLNKLGANISFINKKGFPPLKIKQKIKQKTNKITIKGNISSQFISALLMISPKLKNGLELKILKPFYSKPYIIMTLKIMSHFGIKYKFSNSSIIIHNQEYKGGTYNVESDWSAASYWYSILALNNDINTLTLNGLKKNSLQGDIIISEIMKEFGIKTKFNTNGVTLNKYKKELKKMKIDFTDCPDIAQTVMVVAAMKKVKLELKGLESLKIKETDRIKSMNYELNKIGAKLIFNKKWRLEYFKTKNYDNIEIDTYDDHRIAMAFAPISSIIPIKINNHKVVEKSYPSFWRDLIKVGYVIKENN